MMTWESMKKTKINRLTGKTNDNKLCLFHASGLCFFLHQAMSKILW